MTNRQKQPLVLDSILAVVLMMFVGFSLISTPALAAEAEDEEIPSGAPTEEPKEPVEAEVHPVPDGVDGDLELNPVSREALDKLAKRFPINHKIFRKYAPVPCTFTGSCPGIDHLAAGAGTRNAGFGTIRFRGMPLGAIAVSAFLYWAQIDTALPATQTVSFNGTAVTGFQINTAPSPCWGAGTFVAYRAPVLPFLLPGINGDYSVTGLPSSLTDGRDPWNPLIAPGAPLSEGASLVVLYTHPSVPAGTWTQIHHPIVTQTFGTTTYTHFLNLPIQVAARKHSRLGGDGQVGFGLNNFIATSFESTSLAGPLPSAFVQIRGAGAFASGNQDSDWNGHDGQPLNQLWDTQTLNIPGAIAPGPFTTNYRVRYVANSDCIVPVAHVLTAR